MSVNPSDPRDFLAASPAAPSNPPTPHIAPSRLMKAARRAEAAARSAENTARRAEEPSRLAVGAPRRVEVPAKLASDAQVSANRENAQHSTGPRTPEGKARVSQNARKHGLYSRGFAEAFSLSPEDTEFFNETLAGLLNECAPADRRQTDLVRRLHALTWRLDFLNGKTHGSMGAPHNSYFPLDQLKYWDALGKIESRVSREMSLVNRELASLKRDDLDRAERAEKSRSRRSPPDPERFLADLDLAIEQTSRFGASAHAPAFDAGLTAEVADGLINSSEMDGVEDLSAAAPDESLDNAELPGELEAKAGEEVIAESDSPQCDDPEASEAPTTGDEALTDQPVTVDPSKLTQSPIIKGATGIYYYSDPSDTP